MWERQLKHLGEARDRQSHLCKVSSHLGTLQAGFPPSAGSKVATGLGRKAGAGRCWAVRPVDSSTSLLQPARTLSVARGSGQLPSY